LQKKIRLERFGIVLQPEDVAIEKRAKRFGTDVGFDIFVSF